MERRTLCAALLALLLLALCPAALAEGSWADEDNYDTSWYSDTETVFHIKTPAQLAGLMKLIEPEKGFSGKTIYLDADLDMGAHEWFCPMNWPFMGTFDGLGHTISGLHMSGQHQHMGLFGGLQGATVQNLSIVNASFTSTAEGGYFGLLAAWAVSDGNPLLIRNCTTSGSITANKTGTGAGQCRVGGLVGYADGLTVQACASDAELKCDSRDITNSHSGDYMGGIIGYSDRAGATVRDCLFSGTIESWNNRSGAYISGMVGLDSVYGVVTVSNCLMLGLMKGASGGILNPITFSRIASADDNRITDCYYVERDGEGEQGTGGSSSGYPGIPDNGAEKKTTDEIKAADFPSKLNENVSRDVVWAAGTGGTPKPGFKLADYTEADAAIDEAKALNRDDYVNFYIVDEAVGAVAFGLPCFDQPEVTAMAQAVKAAIAALILRANYAALYDAVALVPDDLSLYTEESRTPLRALIDGIDWDLPEDKQAEVDAMAQAILDAIAALVRIPTLPQTGDTSRLPLWVALTLASLLALAALTGRKGKKPLSQPR